MYFSKFLLALFLIAAVSACKYKTDRTEFAKRLIKNVKNNEAEPLRLPRRLAADVYLNRGYVYGLEGFRLQEEPVQVVCYNDTVGALQLKVKAENVSVLYDWIYGDNESWGKAKLPGQDIYLDIDIERDTNLEQPELLAIYVSEPIKNEFNVDVLGGKHSNVESFKHSVAQVARAAFGRDLRLTLIYDIGPRIEEFLKSNNFDIE